MSEYKFTTYELDIPCIITDRIIERHKVTIETSGSLPSNEEIIEALNKKYTGDILNALVINFDTMKIWRYNGFDHYDDKQIKCGTFSLRKQVCIINPKHFNPNGLNFCEKSHIEVFCPQSKAWREEQELQKEKETKVRAELYNRDKRQEERRINSKQSDREYREDLEFWRKHYASINFVPGENRFWGDL